MTITAWESADDPRRLTTAGPHPKAMQAFFGPDLAAGGWTSVWVPSRINVLWVRCTACGKMVHHDGADQRCACGASLGAVPSYW